MLYNAVSAMAALAAVFATPAPKVRGGCDDNEALIAFAGRTPVGSVEVRPRPRSTSTPPAAFGVLLTAARGDAWCSRAKYECSGGVNYTTTCDGATCRYEFDGVYVVTALLVQFRGDLDEPVELVAGVESVAGVAVGAVGVIAGETLYDRTECEKYLEAGGLRQTDLEEEENTSEGRDVESVEVNIEDRIAEELLRLERDRVSSSRGGSGKGYVDETASSDESEDKELVSETVPRKHISVIVGEIDDTSYTALNMNLSESEGQTNSGNTRNDKTTRDLRISRQSTLAKRKKRKIHKRSNDNPKQIPDASGFPNPEATTLSEHMVESGDDRILQAGTRDPIVWKADDLNITGLLEPIAADQSIDNPIELIFAIYAAGAVAIVTALSAMMLSCKQYHREMVRCEEMMMRVTEFSQVGDSYAESTGTAAKSTKELRSVARVASEDMQSLTKRLEGKLMNYAPDGRRLSQQEKERKTMKSARNGAIVNGKDHLRVDPMELRVDPMELRGESGQPVDIGYPSRNPARDQPHLQTIHEWKVRHPDTDGDLIAGSQHFTRKSLKDVPE